MHVVTITIYTVSYGVSYNFYRRGNVLVRHEVEPLHRVTDGNNRHEWRNVDDVAHNSLFLLK